MVYLDHRKRYVEYQQACDDLAEILDEWTLAFQRTVPKISYGDKVQGNPVNKIEEYIIEVEEKGLRQRKEVAEQIIDGRKKLLAEAEGILRKSGNIYDLIYTMRWVDGLRPKDVYRRLDLMGKNYSESQIYEITKRIRAQIERTF
jgi:gamma-glutamylcysteine synthetase